MTSSPKKLLFVCSGNICRSPMAEGMARTFGEQSGIAVDVQSAGTLGIEDHPAHERIVQACAKVGVDVYGHRSQGITDELVEWADMVLVMELAHAEFIREHHPHIGEKMFMLGNFGGLHEIDDPIGGWWFAYGRSREEVERCVRGLLSRIGGNSSPNQA